MNACRNNTKCTKAHCPYFHSDTQKRIQAPDGFKLQPRNRTSYFRTNEYLAEYIQNQAQWVLPHRREIYHPSTAPFVNADVFMRLPYYIIHASLGFKDKSLYSYYLSSHAEEQHEYKQKAPISNSSKNKIPRTYSHNSQMNAASSVPFYPGKNKAIPKPMMQHTLNSYTNINKRFPTSVSHGMIAGMGGNDSSQKMYGGPPGLEKSIPSTNNLYRPQVDEMNENWNRPSPYNQDMNYNMGWQSNASMIPSALQSQHQEGMPMKKKAANMKGSMSTEFVCNFGSKLLNDNEDKFQYGFLENNSDSDDSNQQVSHPFPPTIEPINKFNGPSYRNPANHEEAKE